MMVNIHLGFKYKIKNFIKKNKINPIPTISTLFVMVYPIKFRKRLYVRLTLTFVSILLRLCVCTFITTQKKKI